MGRVLAQGWATGMPSNPFSAARIGSAPEMYWRSWCALRGHCARPAAAPQLRQRLVLLADLGDHLRRGRAKPDAARPAARPGRRCSTAHLPATGCAGESAGRESVRPRTHGRAGTGWACRLRQTHGVVLIGGRQCDAASISMLEMTAVGTAMPGDNRRSDPAMQMRLGHKQRRRLCRQAILRSGAGTASACEARCPAARSAASAMRACKAALLICSPSKSAGVAYNRQRVRLQETEQRPQLVVDHQRMALAAAGRRQQHRRIHQRFQPDEIDQVLEQPGIGTAIPAPPPPAARCLDCLQCLLWLAPLHRATATAPANAIGASSTSSTGMHPLLQRRQQVPHQQQRA